MKMKTPKIPRTALEKQALLRRRLFRICLTGILISLGMVTKLATSIPIPVLGPGGMKIGFSGIFTALPAFLFGPLYGGIASAMSDLIGAIVKPDGAYIPWLLTLSFLQNQRGISFKPFFCFVLFSHLFPWPPPGNFLHS